MAEIRELEPTFSETFEGGIAMELRRLDPWHWSAVSHRAIRAAAAMKEGHSTLEKYGFEAEEFEVLADPSSWDGITDYIYAVELGMVAINSWSGFNIVGAEGANPVKFEVVSRLFRIQKVREHFLHIMNENGHRVVLVAEGNA